LSMLPKKQWLGGCAGTIIAVCSKMSNRT